MTSRRVSALTLVAVLTMVGGFVLPAALSGQSTASALGERELAWRAAVQSYEAALAARRVIENQWRAALDSVAVSRASGDQERYNRASAAFLVVSSEYERLDLRVRAVQDTLAGRRTALIEALDDRVTELVEQAEAQRDATQREGFLALARDLQNQYRELVEEGSSNLVPTPVFYPGSLDFNPRDTPDLIQAKAQLVERRIQTVQLQIAEAAQRREGIERLIRLRRQQDNFNAPLDRFGDVQVPVVTGGQSQNRAETAVRDSTGASAPPPSLEEQLSAWDVQERQLRMLLEQLQENLRRFRARIGAEG